MTDTDTDTDNVQYCNAKIFTAKGNEKYCKKPYGHDQGADKTAADKKHSSTIRKEYAEVSLDTLSSAFSVVEKPEEAAKLAPKTHAGAQAEPRSAVLLKLDEDNQALYDAWKDAGSPSEFTRPLGKLAVAPEEVETWQFLIRKSVNFLGYGVTYGDAGVRLKDGRTVISWQVRDKRERNTD